MAWAMVIAAGLLEMVWSYSAKRSDGLTRLGWAGLTVIASLASFCLLVFSMRRLPLGTAYAVWTGIGATGSFLVGIAASSPPIYGGLQALRSLCWACAACV
jgi:quaternary ammonium compound-resistance protein SugE